MAVPQALAILVAVVQLGWLGAAASRHTVGGYEAETDFYMFYGPAARAIAAGEWPTDRYHGPGYAATLVAISTVTGADPFTAGKWLSVVCAAAAGGLLFLIFGRLFGPWVGLGAQLLLLGVAHLARFAVTPMSDLPFLVACLGTLALLLGKRPWFLVAGMLAAVATTMRGNGMFLVATAVLAPWVLDARPRGRCALAAAAGAAAILGTWIVAGTLATGRSPVPKNHIQIAEGFFGDVVPGKTGADLGPELRQKFPSLGAVLRHDPPRLARDYIVHIAGYSARVVNGLGFVAVSALAFLGVLLVLWRGSRPVVLLLVAAALDMAVLALVRWEMRYHFFIAAVLIGFAAAAPALALARLGPRACAWSVAAGAVVALAAVPGQVRAYVDVQALLAAQPVEVPRACPHLPPGSRIVSRKPHLAWWCGGSWLFFPDVLSAEAVLAFARGERADVIAFGAPERRFRGAVRLDEAGLPVVWSDEAAGLVLYQVPP